MIEKIRGIAGQFLADQRGATAIEYGLIVALISIGLLILVQGSTGEVLADTFQRVADGVEGSYQEGSSSSSSSSGL